MASISWSERGDELAFEETRRARWRAAARRGALATPAAALALGLVLLPDFLGRYRAEDPTGGALFVAALGAAGALLGAALAISRLLVRSRWVLAPGAGELRHERALPGRAPSVEALALSDVRLLEATPSALVAQLVGGERLELIAGPGDELAELAGALERALARRRLELEVRRPT